MLAESKLLEG